MQVLHANQAIDFKLLLVDNAVVVERGDFYVILTEVYYLPQKVNLSTNVNPFIFTAENYLTPPSDDVHLVISLYAFPLLSEIEEEPL